MNFLTRLLKPYLIQTDTLPNANSTAQKNRWQNLNYTDLDAYTTR